MSKMYYSTDREGYIHSHPTVEIDDEYWRLLEITTHRLWRQKMIRERETVLCPPEGVKAMMWQGKAADVSIKNYPNVVHTSKHEAYGNYCYYCFHRSGSLAWAIWESRMCQASSSWDEERIAAKVIKEWWKKVYWSPDTRVGKKRFYQGLIKDELMTKEDIDVEHWTDEQFLEGAE